MKAYCQMGLDIGFMDGQETIKTTLEQAEPHLAKLKGLAKGEQAGILIAGMEKSWPEIRAIASKPVDKAQAAALLVAADGVVNGGSALVELLLPGSPSSEPVVIVDRMRFLTQRITSLYLLTNWGVDKPELQESYKDAMTKFDDWLIELSHLSQRSEGLGTGFKNISRKWVMYKESTAKGQLPSLAVRMLESIMSQLDSMLKDPALTAAGAPTSAN